MLERGDRVIGQTRGEIMERGSAKVLVVEDDDGNRLLVRRVLEESGYMVIEASDGPTALGALVTHEPDAVVLDLGLPGLDGISVLGEIRRASSVPVLLLTARSGESERVDGLDAGADDYMVKPYSVNELSARVRALLRRSQPEPALQHVHVGEVELDLAANTASVEGSLVDLTPKEFGLLRFLAMQSPETFSREALLHHVWGSTSDWQDPATVTEHIRRVRTKLAAAGATTDVIVTVRGFGYRIAQV
ncbi:MAG TPA: response regulator transcription factor [Acidimicrobiia bacterium]|jgi:DNA-binding response OmpR family regulator